MVRWRLEIRGLPGKNRKKQKIVVLCQCKTAKNSISTPSKIPLDLPERIASSKTNVLLVGYLLAGAILYGYAVTCGLGLTFDSQHYLAAARSLLRNGTLQNPDGTVFSNWPPLYPVLLAMARADWQWIRAGQFLVFEGILFLTWQLGKEALQTTHARLFLALVTLFGTPLLLVNVFVWSEGVFILLTLAMYLSFGRYVATDRLRWLIGLTLLSDLLCLQRLVGILWVLAFATLLYLVQKRARTAIAYVVLSCLPVVFWLWRNVQVEATPSFLGNIGAASFVQTCMGYTDAIGNWFVPTGVPLPVKAAVGVLWIAGILFFLVRHRPTVGSVAFQANYLTVFYLAGMIFLKGTFTEIDRFAVPAFGWLFLGLAAVGDTVRPLGWRRWLIIGVVGVWLLYPVSRTVKNAAFWHEVNCQVRDKQK